MSHSVFAESKTMETFHPDMSTYVKSCTPTRPRKSEWCRVILLSVVVVSRSSWMVFILYGGYAHVFTEAYGWGKPRSMSGQIYGGVGRTRLDGHETRPKPKPNVNYYFVSYLLLLLLLLNVY